MNALQIERAHTRDIPALLTLEELCFTTDKLSAKQFRHFLQSPSALLAVVKSQAQKNADHLVAYALVLFRRNSCIARLYSIAVAPQSQHQGIAGKLSAFIESHSIARQCQEIRLEVRKDNAHAIVLYKKNNYEIIGEHKKFYEDGEDAWKMRKFLDHVKLKQTDNNFDRYQENNNAFQ